MTRWIVSIGLAVGCSGTSSRATPPSDGPTGEAAAPIAAPVKTRALTKDETLTTASGATFTISAGWTLEERPDAITLTAPEGDLRIGYVEVTEPDRDKAIAVAWKRVGPAVGLEVADALDLPPFRGWDANYQARYRTPPAEERAVFIIARRKGPTWFIALTDGKEDALERRNAEVNNTLSSLKVKGLDPEESFAGKKANQLDATRIGELDRFIEEARALANVPGAAVAVVQNGAVVLAKGYGVKKRGAKGKVGPRTLFLIGSITKPMTALMMARLIDEGKFTWDTPVTTVLPSFALGDPATTKRMQMRHTVCACSGMPSQEYEFAFEWTSAEERMARMSSLMPIAPFGETFQYSNLMVMAGGYAAAHVRSPKKKLLPAYREAMQALVFAPLGMKSTTFDFERAARADHTVPHPRDLHGQPIAMPLDAEGWTRPLAPAGCPWSSAEDMARFILLELGKGEMDGKQLVSEQQLMARRVPQVKVDDVESYGLAWQIAADHGLATIGHGGVTNGFNAQLQFMPEHGVGIIVLANAGDSGVFHEAVLRRFRELLFDLEARAMDDLTKSLALIADLRTKGLARIAEADPVWFDPLAGAWTAPGLGRIELARDKRGATLDAGEWRSTVGKTTRTDGTVALVTTGVEMIGVELVPRDQNGRTVLVIEDGQREYVFERAK